MTEITYLRCAETAKLVRGALKAAFPGSKFSVRSDVYAGGATIRVHWTGGPLVEDVEKIAAEARKAHYGVTFILCDRDRH